MQTNKKKNQNVKRKKQTAHILVAFQLILQQFNTKK